MLRGVVCLCMRVCARVFTSVCVCVCMSVQYEGIQFQIISCNQLCQQVISFMLIRLFDHGQASPRPRSNPSSASRERAASHASAPPSPASTPSTRVSPLPDPESYDLKPRTRVCKTPREKSVRGSVRGSRRAPGTPAHPPCRLRRHVCRRIREQLRQRYGARHAPWRLPCLGRWYV